MTDEKNNDVATPARRRRGPEHARHSRLRGHAGRGHPDHRAAAHERPRHGLQRGRRAEPGLRPGQDRGPLRQVARVGRTGSGDSGGPVVPGTGGQARGGRARQVGGHPAIAARGRTVLTLLAVAPRPTEPAVYELQEVTELGEFNGPRLVVGLAAQLLEWVPGRRWLLDAASSSYPAILAAGVRIDRCHDITLSERILLSREGRFAVPCSAAAVHARAAGLPVPRDPDPAATGAQPMLFVDSAGSPSGAGVVDPIEVLRAALVDQRRRTQGDGALALLLAAESASGLTAVEMGRTGLPWRADIHIDLLTRMLGPRPRPGERPARLSRLAAEITDAFGFSVNPGFRARPARRLSPRRLRHREHPVVGDQGTEPPRGRRPVLAYKELSRVHSANGWNWLDEWVRGGRFHPEYLPGSVVSGRWATRGGGALQIPRALRKAVVADPGTGWSSRTPLSSNPGCSPRFPEMLRCRRSRPTRTCTPRWPNDGFGGDRAHAKVAMLGAMYGATTGEAGRLLGTLRARYPVAMACVETRRAGGTR